MAQQNSSNRGTGRLCTAVGFAMFTTMTPSGHLLLWPCLTGLLALASPSPSARAAERPGAAQFQREVQPILAQYCSDCHADGAKKGGVAFDEFKSDPALLENRDFWWNVLKYLRAGLMPPAKKPRPTAEEKQRVADWIKSAVFETDPRNPDPGRVTVRRLNRVEYRNTIRDLLGVDFNTEVEFPPDDTGYGFDNIGDVLTLSPMLLEKYVAAARTILAEAVPTVSKVMPEVTLAGSRFRDDGADNRGGLRKAGRDGVLSLPYDKPAAVSTGFTLEHAGHYRLALELAVKGDFDFDARKCRIGFKLDDRDLLQKEFGWYENKTFPFEFDEDLPAGEHRLALELHPTAADAEETNTLVMRIVSVTVRGPFERSYWVPPKNYERIFTRKIPELPAERRQYAGEILRRFAGQAFRRPVDDPTVDRLTALAEGVYTQPGKTFEAGVGYAMEAVIASPRFLFRLEQSSPEASPAAAWSPVDEYSLASRLSYFLWSTQPDEELIRLAGRGELRKSLAAEVVRMMADARSQALIENFTGQWLQVRDLQGIAIDARVVLARDSGTEKQMRQQREAFLARLAQHDPTAPAGQPGQTNAPGQVKARKRPAVPGFLRPRFELDHELRQAMKSEAEMFFASVVREDRSVTELIDSDYTFLNEKLANFYGLTNLQVAGTEMRRVSLPAGCPRGGVLTLGSVLAVTSNPDRTSPVKRGVFVLNNILGTPAPPPPPNVPALEASEKDFTNKEPTLRVALEMHRSQPLCASCHARMDPIGLGLENFNALGMWRDKERNQLIEPAGKLITGESFNDVRELKHILMKEHRTDFYRCLTQKLLTYALGRGLECYDVETVDQIVDRLERENGRFSVLLMGIIESAPFQERRNQANATFADSTEPAGPADGPSIAKNQSAP